MQSVQRVGRYPTTWALGLEGRTGDCAHVLRIPLVLSLGNEEVPAVAGEGTPARTMKIKGPVTPLSVAAEQVGC